MQFICLDYCYFFNFRSHRSIYRCLRQQKILFSLCTNQLSHKNGNQGMTLRLKSFIICPIIPVLGLVIALYIWWCVVKYIPPEPVDSNQNSYFSLFHDTEYYAIQVTTNLVSVPCNCGFCRPEEGIAVPEHINQIGYDLKYEISTNYFPVHTFSPQQFR